MDFKLELIVLPAADIDASKEFYVDRAGFRLDVDFSAGDFRVVQLTPPGSACSVSLMPRTDPAAAPIRGLHLVVIDIHEARAELVGRGLEISEVFHFGPAGEQPGPDPNRADYNSFASFSDPDGNHWLLQEVRVPRPRG